MNHISNGPFCKILHGQCGSTSQSTRWELTEKNTLPRQCYLTLYWIGFVFWMLDYVYAQYGMAISYDVKTGITSGFVHGMVEGWESQCLLSLIEEHAHLSIHPMLVPIIAAEIATYVSALTVDHADKMLKLLLAGTLMALATKLTLSRLTLFWSLKTWTATAVRGHPFPTFSIMFCCHTSLSDVGPASRTTLWPQSTPCIPQTLPRYVNLHIYHVPMFLDLACVWQLTWWLDTV